MNSDNPFKVDLTNVPKDKIFYALAMFPYPSGAGLHVGHALPYTVNDIIARYKRMNGFAVLNPIGWDSFGLPTEGYAMKVGRPASEVTKENIASFIEQCKLMDWSYDRDREFATSDPEYYKWTQRIFQQLYKAGLVYRKDALVNRCPQDQTVLANDQVVDGKCERCGTEVVQKKHMQRFIKITDYADKLISDLDLIDRPEETKTQQKYWIGKSEGAEINFPINEGQHITVFTTRPDTIYGVTAIVLAPENDTLDSLLSTEKKAELTEYRKITGKKTNLERQQDADERSGMFSGVYATHPLTNEQVPVRYADYVLMDYATGAVMSVPAHDERDCLFALKHDLPFVCVLRRKSGQQPEENIKKLFLLADEYFQANKIPYYIFGSLTKDIEAGKRLRDHTDLDVVLDQGQIPGLITFLKEQGFTQVRDWNIYKKDGYGAIEYYGVDRNAENKNVADENLGIIVTPSDIKHATFWGKEVDYVQFSKVKEFNDGLAKAMRKKTGRKEELGENEPQALVNSGLFDGLDSEVAKKKITEYLEVNGLGKAKVTYKLRDRSVSRQRYWGSPIPVYYDEAGNPQLIPEEELPVVLPLDLGNYKPAGKSPLADHPIFPHYIPANKKVPLFENDDNVWKRKEGVEVKRRKIVQAIIKDKTSDKYLALNWKIDNSRSLVAGGVEAGEDNISALKREIAEEAGFKECNIKYQIGGEIHKKLYHAVKKYNQYSDVYTYYVEVDAKSQVAIDAEELERHEPVWMTEKEILSQKDFDPELPYLFGLLNGKNIEPQSRTDKYNEYNPQPTYLRECDTLDTFMCSSFYFLRFIDPKNEKELVSKELADKTMPVDFYIGGKEHTYGHLLYARFIHKFLFDQGYVSSPEPFQRLIHQGFILGPDGRKMSKRWGNVINPSEVALEHGSDTLRTYVMFMGPIEIEKVRNVSALMGVKKFLERVERLEQFIVNDGSTLDSTLHKTIKGATEDVERTKFNTAVSKLMVFVNDVYDKKAITKEQLSVFLQLLAPFATRLTQQMWEKLGNEGNIHFSNWPQYDASKIAEDTINLPMQINGKMKGTIEVSAGLSQDEVMKMIRGDEKLNGYIGEKEIAKIIFVQDKIVNLIIK